MGLDYGFIAVIPKEEKDRLFEYIRKHGTIDDGNCALVYILTWTHSS